MTLQTYTSAVSYLLINDAYPNALIHRESVVKQAIENRKTVPKESSKFIRETLSKAGFKIPGFRRFFDAPANILLPQFQELSLQYDIIIVGILSIWIDTELQLKKDLTEFLLASDIEVVEFHKLISKANHSIPVCLKQDAQIIWQDFQKLYSHYDINNIALMFIGLTGIIPVNEEMIQHEDASGWDEIKSSLSNWTPDSSYWEVFASFKVQVEKLIEFKQNQLTKLPLQKDLEQLWLIDLGWFELSDAFEWSIDNVSNQDASIRQEQVQRLIELLNGYIEMMNIQPSSIQNRRELEGKLTQYQDEIVDLTMHLRGAFNPENNIESVSLHLDYESLEDSPFKEWLSTLETLPLTDTSWSNAWELLNSLETIVAEKTSNLHQITRLIEAIDAIQNVDAELLQFFQIEPDQWSHINIEAEEANLFADDIFDVITKFENYVELSKHSPANFIEAKEIRKKIGELDTEIDRIVKTLRINLKVSGESEGIVLDLKEEASQAITTYTSVSEQEDLESVDIDIEITEDDELAEQIFIDDPIIDSIITQLEQLPEEIEYIEEIEYVSEEHPILHYQEDDTVPLEVFFPSELETFSNADYLTQDSNQQNLVMAITHSISMNESPTQNIKLLIWELITENRLSTAYQLLKCAEDAYGLIDPKLQSWILKAVLLGKNIRFSTGASATELKECFGLFLSNDFPELDSNDPTDLAIIILLLAASLRPALLAPQIFAGDVLRSLKIPQGLETTYRYQQRITQFAHEYRALDTSALMSVQYEAIWESELVKLQNEIKQWLHSTREIRFSFQPATIVWQLWHMQGGYLDQLLKPILENNSETYEYLQTELENNLSNHDQIRQLVLRDYNQSGHFRMKYIETRALGSIQNWTQEVADFIRRWLILLESKYSTKQFEQQRAEALYRDIRSMHDDVIDSITKYLSNCDVLEVKASLPLLRESIEDILGLFDPEIALHNSSIQTRFLLNIDFLRIADLDIDDNWDVIGSEPVDIIKLLLDSIRRPIPQWDDVYTRYEKNWNHEATQYVIDYISSPTSSISNIDVQQLIESREQHIKDCRALLERTVNKVSDDIEQAVAYGLLDEEERHQQVSIIDSVKDALKNRSDFHRMHDKLDNVTQKLAHAREQKKDEIRHRVETIINHVQNEDDKNLLTSTIEAGDIVTANEYIEMIMNGQILSERIVRKQHPFEEFFPETAYQIEKYLEERRDRYVIEDIKNGRDIPGLNMRQVPGAQAQEAATMMSAWYSLKRNMRETLTSDLRKLLNAIGFNVKNIQSAGVAYSNQVRLDIETTPLNDRASCPMPIFGSQANGHYQVVCIWGRPPEDRIMDDIGTTKLRMPTIVLYFGRMTEQRSRDLAKLCRERHRTFLLVDEKIMLYLCGERGARLPIFFALTLPFTFYTPYTITSGVVPPEMFYGRVAEKDSVIDTHGSCFIYGGRQLGKTVLLRAVENEFHDPDKGRIAIWLDLKAEGIGYGSRLLDDLWRSLSRLLNSKSDNIFTHVHTDAKRLFSMMDAWLAEKPSRRILFLLDEADKFLEADGQQNFEFSAEIKGWMDKTNRRIKVVFAGLHNVLRTTTQSNHPLAHYGEPICIGPLINGGEWREARRLVEFPMISLGYKFETNTDLVTRILSQTNYYPSLIQIYCNKLLDHVISYSSRSDNILPYVISSTQVDEVYHRKDVRELIRDRFKLTLQLDLRYEVIANIIAYHSLIDSDRGLVEGFSDKWIENEAKYWWAEGFAENTRDNSFSVLLQEMEGLGVLRRTATENYYALRSPNVSLLMGQSEEIVSTLVREREVPVPYAPAKFRPAFGDNTEKCSPLTAQQEAMLRSHKFGISIIFGTDASGLDDLLPYFRAKFQNEPMHIIEHRHREHDFLDMLRNAISHRDKEGTTLIVVANNCLWGEEWITSTYNILNQLKNKKSYVRVVFVADPDQTKILINHNSELLDLLNKGDDKINSICLAPWENVAVNQWLENIGYAIDEVADKQYLSQQTGNWPILLYHMYESAKSRRRGSWRPALESLMQRLIDDDDFRQEIVGKFGIKEQETKDVLAVLAQWQKEGEITLEILHEFVDHPSDIVDKAIQWAELLNLVDSRSTDSGEVAYQLNETLAHILLLEKEDG